MLPSGWKHTPIEDHIDLLSGFPFKSVSYTSNKEDVRLLRGDNIEPGSLRWRDVKKWPITQFKELKKYQLKEGDFVIAMDRTWVTAGLKVAVVRERDVPCLLVQRVSRIRSKDTLDQKLLKQIFSGFSFEQYVKSVQTETAVPHISAQQIRDFPIFLPPLNEQNKIATILSTWDKAIETTENLLANSQQQKKSLMQQLLTGKKRLKGFSGEWKQGYLGDIAVIDSGYAFKSADFTDSINSVPIIRMSDLKEGGLDLSSPARVAIESTIGLEKFALKSGDFVFGMSGSLENYAWVKKSDLPCFLNQRVGRLVSNDRADSLFVTYLYLSDHVQNDILDKAAGAAQLNISVSDLRKTKVFYPALAEQKKIAELLSVADCQMNTYENQLADLQQEKKALMQILLTGKRRVKV